MVFAKRVLFALVAASLLLGSSAALAQEDGETEILKKDDVKKEENKSGRPDGIDGSLSAEGTFNAVSNSNVVGQNDGISLLLGANLSAGLDLIDGDHVVSNTLTYNTSWARTPVIDEFVKNNDSIQLENLYNYFVTEWFGPYGRLSFETSVFPTERVTADPVDYDLPPYGEVDPDRSTRRLRLAEPFNPFELFQSAGVFIEPVRAQALQMELRVGFGARETLADGVLVVQDDSNTSNRIEVVELDDAIQAGAEAFLGAKGKFPEQRLSYRAGGTMLMPFINNDDTDRSSVELTRLGFTGDITYNALEWLGVSYNVKVLDDPQLLNKTQVQNSVLLTFSYAFFEAEEGIEPPPSKEGDEEKPVPTEELEKAEKRAQEAEERAEEAEERAEEAEERAAELEEELEDAQQQAEQSEQQLEEADDTVDEPESDTQEEQPEEEPTEPADDTATDDGGDTGADEDTTDTDTQ